MKWLFCKLLSEENSSFYVFRRYPERFARSYNCVQSTKYCSLFFYSARFQYHKLYFKTFGDFLPCISVLKWTCLVRFSVWCSRGVSLPTSNFAMFVAWTWIYNYCWLAGQAAVFAHCEALLRLSERSSGMGRLHHFRETNKNVVYFYFYFRNYVAGVL